MSSLCHLGFYACPALLSNYLLYKLLACYNFNGFFLITTKCIVTFQFFIVCLLFMICNSGLLQIPCSFRTLTLTQIILLAWGSVDHIVTENALAQKLW